MRKLILTLKMTEEEARAVYRLIGNQVATPEGCDPDFIVQLEQVQHELMKLLDEDGSHWSDGFRKGGE